MEAMIAIGSLIGGLAAINWLMHAAFRHLSAQRRPQSPGDGGGIWPPRRRPTRPPSGTPTEPTDGRPTRPPSDPEEHLPRRRRRPVG